ncbi:hypothetical protein ACJX0J_015062, partial [Zea mays]
VKDELPRTLLIFGIVAEFFDEGTQGKRRYGAIDENIYLELRKITLQRIYNCGTLFQRLFMKIVVGLSYIMTLIIMMKYSICEPKVATEFQRNDLFALVLKVVLHVEENQSVKKKIKCILHIQQNVSIQHVNIEIGTLSFNRGRGQIRLNPHLSFSIPFSKILSMRLIALLPCFYFESSLYWLYQRDWVVAIRGSCLMFLSFFSPSFYLLYTLSDTLIGNELKGYASRDGDKKVIESYMKKIGIIENYLWSGSL